VKQENGRLFPKIEPQRGSLHAEMKRCGRRNCRCARGEPHGPYWYVHRWEGGKKRRRYVKRSELDAARAGIIEWRRLHPPLSKMRAELALLRRLLRGLGD
jgi:hypothetical protein